MSRAISNTDSVIDSRDILARISELESEVSGVACPDCNGTGGKEDADGITTEDPCERCEGAGTFDLKTQEEAEALDLGEEFAELTVLRALAEECEGYGDWRHGAALIHDSYFETYAREFAEDIGAIGKDTSWPATCIDWDRACRELQHDYMRVDFGGEEYWMRS
jgi:hypothetical protein